MRYRKYLAHICIFSLCIFGILAPLYSDAQNTAANANKSAAKQNTVLFADVPQTSPFSEQEYDRLILKMYVSSANNPSYWFEKGEWKLQSENCWVTGGEDEVVSPYQVNMIKQVRYYRYKNMHPLDPSYYAQDEDTVDFLKRFCFYRFTGKTMLPWLDAYLFALDMHTGFIFSYALPSRFDKVLGKHIPRDWVALENHPYVQANFPDKKFYQFDPVGIMQADGKILLYDWIIEQNKRKDTDIGVYIPHHDDYANVASNTDPGCSPYRTGNR